MNCIFMFLQGNTPQYTVLDATGFHNGVWKPSVKTQVCVCVCVCVWLC